MNTYTATNISTHEEIRFRKLAALVRRLGGSEYTIEHDTAFRPPTRVVAVLKRARYGDGWHVLARVSISFEALPDVLSDEERERWYWERTGTLTGVQEA